RRALLGDFRKHPHRGDREDAEKGDRIARPRLAEIHHEEIGGRGGQEPGQRQQQFHPKRHALLPLISHTRIAPMQIRTPSEAIRTRPATASPVRPSRRRAGMAWNSSGMNRNRMPATTTIVLQRSSAQAKASVPASSASHSAVLPSTSSTGPDPLPSRPRSGYRPASCRNARQQTLHNSANQDSAAILGSRWFNENPSFREHGGGRDARRPRGLAHVGFDIARVVAVEDMPEHAAIEVGG